jgi:peptidoglycan-associated lipoprotein
MHMRERRFGTTSLLLSTLALALLLAGCPKRPVATVVSAPPPTAPVQTPAPPPEPPAAAPAPPPAPAPAPPVAVAPTPAPPPPPAPAPPPAEFMANPAVQDIFFNFDKSNIRPGDAKILGANAAYLKANPDQLVLIEGHCDERGTNEYNLALGERRAKSAMNYFVAQGIEANRITVVSYGKERPVCTEKAEVCWAKNRRDHFLTKPK